MNESPLVSVLMTAYNREKYIGEAIDGVLRSTLTNWELIIVDDQSKDKTVEIAQSYAARDPRIRFYQNEKNLGDYPNRNKAASYARGKYLKYLDSDDLIYPTGLQVFVAAMEQFPDAALGVTSNFGQEKKPFPFVLSPAEAFRYNFFEKSLFDFGPTGLIFRTDRFREAGGFSGKRYVGDTELNMKLAERWPVVRLASSLIFWRQHEGQEFSAGVGSTGYLELQLPMYREAFARPTCPLSQEEKKKILRYHQKIAARQIMRIAIAERDPKRAMGFYRQLRLGTGDLFNAAFKMKRQY